MVGLAVGLPLGVVVARWAWAGVADRVPLVYVAPFWLTVVLLAIPVFLAGGHRCGAMAGAQRRAVPTGRRVADRVSLWISDRALRNASGLILVSLDTRI